MLFRCKPQDVISILGIIREPPAETGVAGEAPTIDCAWCLADADLAAGNGSHGICAVHAERIIIQARERRRERGAA